MHFFDTTDFWCLFEVVILQRISSLLSNECNPMVSPIDFSSKKVIDEKNIIFDFGGVLMDHNLGGCLQAILPN